MNYWIPIIISIAVAIGLFEAPKKKEEDDE